jgi:hypothetical protein
MKISEVRIAIDKYTPDQLKSLVSQLYKALPKAVKEDYDIDKIIKNPERAQSKTLAIEKDLPDLDSIQAEAEKFIKNAYNQYYFVPNRFVPKPDRLKWRFVVKRLYNQILLAGKESNIVQAVEILEKLYNLLCYSCEITIFNAYDSFQSAGIEQSEFFRKVLSLKSQSEDQNTFIKNALLLLLNNSLNRYTLHETLMQVILEFLKTPDMREKAITTCSELFELIKNQPAAKKNDWSNTEYEKIEKLNNLAEMGFFCYAQLFEYDKAIAYFDRHYHENDKEVSLYVKLHLLLGLNQKEFFIKEYERAIHNGIKPRNTLRKTYQFIREKGELPAYFLA